MKVVVQRCLEAKCTSDGIVTGKIDKGLMILVGFCEEDNEKILEYMAKKIVNLRIFDDENGVMNKSVLDIGGKILSISQFTLYADIKKGNRPSYINALNGKEANVLYNNFNDILKKYLPVEVGKFGCDMKIEFTNDGPVTIILERGNSNV